MTQKQMTPEIKERIFALYWGVRCGINAWTTESRPYKVCPQFLHYSNYERNNAYLLLKPLYSLSSEDTITVAKIAGFDDCDGESFNVYKVEGIYRKWIDIYRFVSDGITREPLKNSIQIVDYLRSKSYATSYLDWTVDELVEAGVYKLQNQ